MSSPMSSDDIAISVRNLTKTYRIFGHPGDRIKQAATLGLRKYHREFTALKDVSFDIKKGETVGIIGRNGSGKSTLLQLICGILKPTSGTIRVNGRISALLELGAGFNPEFTGRENVYFQGALMGFMKAEMHARFDDIAAFADIGEFIDQPVRTYSSGMFVRLAFAVAVNVDPEILVVDEVLAVGDAGFQRKCFSRINAIRALGGTIVFVSHSSADVLQLCNRAILLDGGKELTAGEPKLALDLYNKLICAPPGMAEEVAAVMRGTAYLPAFDLASPVGTRAGNPESMVSYESRGAVISNPCIVDVDGRKVLKLARGEGYCYRYDVRFDAAAENVRFAMMIKTTSGYELGGMISQPPGGGIKLIACGSRVTANFPFACPLLPGHYFLNAGVLGTLVGEEVFLHRVIDILSFEVKPESDVPAGGIVDFSMSNSRITITGLLTES
jgi:lipopolysaccharide transport system ATP-binding protein